LKFNTYQEYETHYQQNHTNRCKSCRKNFPTAHFLELHLAEHHDPIVAAKRDAGEKTYACFVEGCDKVCSEWKKRRSHLVDKHGFPKNYDFLVVDHGVDGRRSMLRPGVDLDGHRKSSRERARSESSATEGTQTTEATSIGEEAAPRTQDPRKTVPTSTAESSETLKTEQNECSTSRKDVSMDELTSDMSTLKMVPRSVTFGKRKGRSGFSKSWKNSLRHIIYELPVAKAIVNFTQQSAGLERISWEYVEYNPWIGTTQSCPNARLRLNERIAWTWSIQWMARDDGDATIELLQSAVDLALEGESFQRLQWQQRERTLGADISNWTAADTSVSKGFESMLMHGTANHYPHDSGGTSYDTGLVYGDYYLLETGNRRLGMK
jgi:hypothetical protein